MTSNDIPTPQIVGYIELLRDLLASVAGDIAQW